MNGLIGLHVKHELRHTEPVTHVDEQHAPVITPAMHPSHQRDGLAILVTRQFSTMVCTLHCVAHPFLVRVRPWLFTTRPGGRELPEAGRALLPVPREVLFAGTFV